MSRLLPLAVAAAALCLPIRARAETPTVGYSLQAVLIKKVLAYHRNAPRPEDLRILVVYDRESSEEVTGVLEDFRAIGLQATAEKIDNLGERPQAFLLYGLPSVPWHRLQGRAIAAQRISVASIPGPVRDGRAAMAFDRSPEGKVTILVHWGELKAEAQDLSSELLKLCVVIR